MFGIGLVSGLVFDELIETIRGEENSTVNTAGNTLTGGAVATTGPFQKKPRGGIAGGGPSKKKTSVASKANHALEAKGKISKQTRNRITKVLRKTPYVGVVIGSVQLADAVADRVELETSKQNESKAKDTFGVQCSDYDKIVNSKGC